MGAYSSCTAYCDDKKRRLNHGDGPYEFHCVNEWKTAKENATSSMPPSPFTHCINICKICWKPEECEMGNSTLLKCEERGLNRGTAFGLVVGLPIGMQLIVAVILFIMFGIRKKKILPDFRERLAQSEIRRDHQKSRLPISSADVEPSEEAVELQMPKENVPEDTETKPENVDKPEVNDAPLTTSGQPEKRQRKSVPPKERLDQVITDFQKRFNIMCIMIGAAIFVATMIISLSISLVCFPQLTKYADNADVAQKFVDKRRV